MDQSSPVSESTYFSFTDLSLRDRNNFGSKTKAETCFNFESDFNTQTKVKNKIRFQQPNIHPEFWLAQIPTTPVAGLMVH